jgi:hypothetical protein
VAKLCDTKILTDKPIKGVFLMKRFIVLLIALTSVTVISACGNSKPSEDKIKTSIKKIMPIEPQITSIKALDYFPGLVEVIIRIDNKPVVFYTDRKGDYIVSGSILKAENKQNMTLDAMKVLAPDVSVVPAKK